MGNSVVGNDPQSPVRLRDIATIEEGIEDRKTLVTGNGKPAAIVNITRQIGGNIVTVSDQVKAWHFMEPMSSSDTSPSNPCMTSLNWCESPLRRPRCGPDRRTAGHYCSLCFPATGSNHDRRCSELSR